MVSNPGVVHVGISARVQKRGDHCGKGYYASLAI